MMRRDPLVLNMTPFECPYHPTASRPSRRPRRAKSRRAAWRRASLLRPRWGAFVDSSHHGRPRGRTTHTVPPRRYSQPPDGTVNRWLPTELMHGSGQSIWSMHQNTYAPEHLIAALSWTGDDRSVRDALQNYPEDSRTLEKPCFFVLMHQFHPISTDFFPGHSCTVGTS